MAQQRRRVYLELTGDGETSRPPARSFRPLPRLEKWAIGMGIPATVAVCAVVFGLLGEEQDGAVVALYFGVLIGIVTIPASLFLGAIAWDRTRHLDPRTLASISAPATALLVLLVLHLTRIT